MIPAWQAVVLALGAYRLTRFLGWDDWPPILRIRAWALGERWVSTDPFLDQLAAEMAKPVVDPDRPVERLELTLPGKTPESEVADVRPAYDRPTLAHLVHCPFCLGWWVSLTVYAAWLLEPSWTLYGAFPFALSGTVGLISKNLDP